MRAAADASSEVRFWPCRPANCWDVAEDFCSGVSEGTGLGGGGRLTLRRWEVLVEVGFVVVVVGLVVVVVEEDILAGGLLRMDV